MVTQAPRRRAVLAALAFTLSCLGLMIFVWTQFGGTIPFAPQSYRVKALFRETGLLVPGADVRIAGVNVGRVSAVSPRGTDSLVTLNLDPAYAPIPSNTRAILRQKTLLGEAYIELSTGSGAPLRDSGTLSAADVAKTQALDQVLSTFTPADQHNLQVFLAGAGAALSARGQTLNDAVGNYDPFVTELTDAIGVLNDQRAGLHGVIDNGGAVLSTIGHHAGDLQRLLSAGSRVFTATAAVDATLRGTVNGLPPFLGQLRTTMHRLNTTLGVAQPSLRALQPVAPALIPALKQVVHVSRPALSILTAAPGLVRAADRALPQIGGFARAFKPAVDALLPAALQLAPVIGYMYTDRDNIVDAMANLAAALQATAPSTSPGGVAHYLRTLVSFGAESVFGQATREPTIRNNTYYAPGELNDIATGLRAASCANLTNPAEIPIPGLTNVPCVVQSPFRWQSGTAPSYYPRLKAAAAGR